MSTWERLQSLFVATAAAAGLAAGWLWPVGELAGHLVLPSLMLMLVAIFTQIDTADLRHARRAHRVVGASLVLNFLFTPALAWALGAGLLGDSPDLRIGLLLLLVTPCTDWYLVFTGLARGHLGIAAAILPINLVLQLLLLPLYVLLLGGEAAMIDSRTLIGAVVLVLVIPLVVAVLLRAASGRGKTGPRRRALLIDRASRIVLPLLYVAIFAMFAWQSAIVTSHARDLLALLLPLGLFFLIVPIVATRTAHTMGLERDQRATLVMTSVARNSPIALAVAVAAFPDRPLIAVALVAGPLIELPVLAVLSQWLRGASGPRR
ncbi:arsenic resistance protein [Natronoglycomyces albus]|uniref:Arsenic resistance protein n=1 Tax=Natronoglycomyces albus TaxID=2811108 RepID=A0A895XPU1_9ACTN|nr:bile acid:sodium symporter [Natronoglycomyces albus]QSB04556.1 arsenic resistance protein [Natronoglycomyces albus]